MKTFNVINFNFNKREFEPYNVIPYLVSCYDEEKSKPETFTEFKDFIKKKSMYQWWARCEYEIILSDWPSQKIDEKWDVYKQVMMNLDVITTLVMDSVLNGKLNKDD